MKNESDTGKIRVTTGSEEYDMRTILISLFLIFLWIGCSAKTDEVTVVMKTKSYHREECRQVMMADIKYMPRAEAQKMNCRACSLCQTDSIK